MVKRLLIGNDLKYFWADDKHPLSVATKSDTVCPRYSPHSLRYIDRTANNEGHLYVYKRFNNFFRFSRMNIVRRSII